MTVTLQLANQVRRLGRREMTVAQIAHRLGRSEQAIADVLSKLGLPRPGKAIEERMGPSTSNRARERLLAFGRSAYVRRMSDRTLVDLYNISEALVDALREAYGVAQTGEFGEPLREILDHAHDLVTLADETLAADAQAGEHARGMVMHMAEQLAALESLFGPIA